MEENYYRISEISKLVGVENHVLRYWEEELGLAIKRNEMGHRFYTEEDLILYQKIKKWKEEGIQLKGIKNMILKGKIDCYEQSEEYENCSTNMKLGELSCVHKEEIQNINRELEKEEKALRLQTLLKNLIQDAVDESNEQLLQEMKLVMSKELDFQFRQAAEEQKLQHDKYMGQQEKYFNKIDQMIEKDMVMRRKKNFLLFPGLASKS